MKLEDVFENIVREVGVSLTEEFDRNFERKAFFDQAWPAEKYANSRGSQMLRSGRLRKSINHAHQKSQIIWRSSLPYASIQNEGGEIEVTAQMKRFFWAMYYKATNAVTTKKNGKESKSARNVKLTEEAKKWKAMALLKVGAKMTIEQRQFIGWHPRVNAEINEVVAFNMREYNDYLQKKLEQNAK